MEINPEVYLTKVNDEFIQINKKKNTTAVYPHIRNYIKYQRMKEISTMIVMLCENGPETTSFYRLIGYANVIFAELNMKFILPKSYEGFKNHILQKQQPIKAGTFDLKNPKGGQQVLVKLFEKFILEEEI